MALTFSLLFTYHVKAAPCRRRAAGSLLLPEFFYLSPRLSPLFYLRLPSMHVLYCLFFYFSNLQALLIYLDAAHDLITRGVKDVRTLTGGGRRAGDQKLNLHKLFLSLCSCDTGLNLKCRGDKICQLSCRRVWDECVVKRTAVVLLFKLRCLTEIC